MEALSGRGFGGGGALRPQMGPGRNPGGGPGGEAPESYWILHIYSAIFYVGNYPFFNFFVYDFYSMILHVRR